MTLLEYLPTIMVSLALVVVILSRPITILWDHCLAPKPNDPDSSEHALWRQRTIELEHAVIRLGGTLPESTLVMHRAESLRVRPASSRWSLSELERNP